MVEDDPDLDIVNLALAICDKTDYELMLAALLSVFDTIEIKNLELIQDMKEAVNEEYEKLSYAKGVREINKAQNESRKGKRNRKAK